MDRPTDRIYSDARNLDAVPALSRTRIGVKRFQAVALTYFDRVEVHILWPAKVVRAPVRYGGLSLKLALGCLAP
jgi:hypothetical protein